ncbi:MAG: 4Fe-4S binding protein [Anaerolineae bacterium]
MDAPLQVHRDACLNRRHRDSHCELCLPCPVHAIRLNNGLPELDAPRCVECGLCISICPTDVYRSTRMSDPAVIELGKRWDQVEFACQRRADVETTRTPAQGLARLPCLARLSPELLVALAAEHAQVWLDDSLCGACPIGAAHASIIRTVHAAQELLGAWTSAGKLHLHTESEGKLSDLPHPFPNERHTGEPLSRRAFLSLLTLNVGRAAASVATGALPIDSLPEPDTQTRVSTLQRAVTRLGAPQADAQGTRLVTLEIDDRCTACGLCAKICPTSAIEFKTQGDHFALAFRPAQCLGLECRLCDRICAPEAITLLPGVRREALSVGHREAVHEGALAICVKCHLPFAANGADTLCAICRGA